MYVYPDHDFVSDSLADPKVGTWEQEELTNIQQAISATARLLPSTEKPLFVDVGSNIGWFSLNAVNMGARVYAFEGKLIRVFSLCCHVQAHFLVPTCRPDWTDATREA